LKKIIFILLISTLLFSSTKSVSIQLDWKHQFEYAGFYVAIQNGYYKDIGLEVELKEFHDKINISDDIVNGNSTFGVSSSSLILSKLQNKPITLLASYFKQNVLALITSEQISSLKDLKNKKIMATPYEIKNSSLGVMMKENGLHENDYTLVNHEFNIEKFANGEVDAMSIFLTNQTYDLNKRNIHYNILNPSDYGIYSYDLELFTSVDFAKNNKKLVKDFILATNKGWKYAFNHKEEIVDLIYNKYTTRKSKEALLYEANKTQELFKTNIFSIGSVVPELVELNALIYGKLGLIKKDNNLKILLSDYIFDNNTNNNIDNHTLNLTQEEKKFISKNKIIKIANEMDWAPFDFNEFGKATGLSIEYIKLIFDKAGLKYKFISGNTWPEILKLFQEKKIDVLPAFYKSDDRKKYTLFTNPYYQGTLSVYTLNQDNGINSISDLSNKKIGIEMSDASIEIVKEHLKDSNIVEISATKKLFEQLMLKKVDAIICNQLLFQHYMKDKNKSDFKLLKYIELDANEAKGISLHIGVRKDLNILHNIIQKSINSLDINELNKLEKQWIGYEKENKTLSKKEKDYLKSKKKITLCIDPAWMPFEEFEDSKHIGLTADYFKIFQNNLDIPIEVKRTHTWSESLKLAKNRECDLLSLAMQTPDRSKYMNFTSPYLNIPLILSTKNDVPFISDFHHLKDEKLGIPTGYAFSEILKQKYPNLNIVEVKNVKEGLEQVREDKLFGYIGTLASVGYLLQKEFVGELKIAGKFDEIWALGVAVRNDDPILLDIFQKLVTNIKPQEHRNILNKWISIKYEEGTNYTLVYQTVAIAIVVLLIILFWNRKLKILNNKLSIARINAEEATQTKANFLANMSHEIRTPMNSIVSMAYLIKESKLNDTQKKYIQTIQSSSQNLLKLLNDILDYSKIEVKKLKLNEDNFSLINTLDNIYNILNIKAQEKNLKFNIIYDKDTINELYGDEQRLSQVLINLLSNAIKFTDNGKVELSVEKLENSKFRFCVSDTGIGLSKEELDIVFLSFIQVDSSSTRKYSGTGLGLSISKELVELMDGKIWVESKKGQGSKFLFEITLRDTRNTDRNKNTLKKVDKAIHKTKINEQDTTSLFKRLNKAVSSRRPKLCEPIIEEIELNNLSKDDKILFEDVKQLIHRYKFNEAKELLNGR